jgi:hypothetical protein
VNQIIRIAQRLLREIISDPEDEEYQIQKKNGADCWNTIVYHSKDSQLMEVGIFSKFPEIMRNDPMNSKFGSTVDYHVYIRVSRTCPLADREILFIPPYIHP